MTEDQTISNEAIAPNAKRLLWAGFMAILAAGVGFAIRDWKSTRLNSSH